MAAAMPDESKTHYRAAMKTVYLASEDITDAVVLTIKYAALERDRSERSGQNFVTAHFVEDELRPGQPLKPMILNNANCKTMRRLTRSPYLENWSGVAITVYVDPTVKFMGETVGGLRISPEPPKVKKPAFDRSNHKMFERAVAAYKRDGNCEAVEEHMTMTGDDKLAIEATAKDMTDGEQ